MIGNQQECLFRQCRRRSANASTADLLVFIAIGETLVVSAVILFGGRLGRRRQAQSALLAALRLTPSRRRRSLKDSIQPHMNTRYLAFWPLFGCLKGASLTSD